MSDFSWQNIENGAKNLANRIDQATDNASQWMRQEWHDTFSSDSKSASPAATAHTDAAKTKVAGTDATAAQPVTNDATALPAPDKNGVLTVSADNPNFQKAIDQPNVKSLVINQRGNVDFQIGLATDAQHQPIFVGTIFEKQGGKIDKKFALPGNVDYVTINQVNKSADGKTDVVTPFTRVAGQGRLQAFKAAMDSPDFYPGSFELKPVAGVAHEYPIPATAGSNDVMTMIKHAGRMPDSLLDLGQKQFRHDATVPENNKDPWFGIQLAQLDVLSAGKNLNDCAVTKPADRAIISNNVDQYLARAQSEYKVAGDIARRQLPVEQQPVHNPIYGQDPRNWREIPRNQAGVPQWTNPQANFIYYGNALDVASYDGAQTKIAKENLKTAAPFVCSESLDRLLP